MNRLLNIHNLAGAVLGAAAAWVTHGALHPELHLSGATLYVFVAENCKYSDRILAQLEVDPSLRARVVPLVADDRSDDLSERVCPIIATDVRTHAPWLSILPVGDAWICERVNAWSAEVYRTTDSFVKVPSWALGRTPIPWQAERRVLAEHGLLVGENGLVEIDATAASWGRSSQQTGPSVNAETPATNQADAATSSPRPATSFRLTHWRGQDIGL